MDDRGAFIAAIAENPDDSLPRLIYADWLAERNGTVPCPSCEAILNPTGGGLWPCRSCGAKEWSEHGRIANGFAERAEFIRLQCKLAAHKCPPPSREGLARYECDECRPLRRREDSLLSGEGGLMARTRRRTWVKAFDANISSWEFRRGFVEEITCSWSGWRTHADAIRAATPLRKVRLTTPPTGDHVHFELMRSDEDFVRCDLYPGIEFEMPQPNIGVDLARPRADWTAFHVLGGQP